MSLPERVAIANAQRDAIFISIHYNATPRAEAEGFETYYYNRHNRRAGRLASTCYSMIVRAWPGSRRGVRVRGFFVIRRTRIPGGAGRARVPTNPYEASLIQRPAMRQRIATLLATAIIKRRHM